MFIEALFTIARTWKQPRCPLTDEWIKKLWYIYTMEYYSAIKSNAFESVLMRWMNLEPITQSEVSQKEKNKYCLLDTYICNLERGYWWIFMLISPSDRHQGPLGSARIAGSVKWLGIFLLPVGWREWTYTLQEPSWFNLMCRYDTRLFKWSIHLCFRQ